MKINILKNPQLIKYGDNPRIVKNNELHSCKFKKKIILMIENTNLLPNIYLKRV